MAAIDGKWAALSHFPVGPAPAKAPTPNDLLAAAPEMPLKRDRTVRAPQAVEQQPMDEQWITHEVTPRDTLQGMALRYGISMSEIKLLNDMATDTLWPIRKTLLIPRGKARVLPKPEQIETDLRPSQLRLFRVKNKISESEAKYYLESNDWDVQVAQAECTRDFAFAENNKNAEATAVASATSRPRGTLGAGPRSGAHTSGVGAAVMGAASHAFALGAGFMSSLTPATAAQAQSGALGVPSTGGGGEGGTSTDDEPRDNQPLLRAEPIAATGRGTAPTGADSVRRRRVGIS